MSKKGKITKTKSQDKRFLAAKKSLKELQEEIEPYVNVRRFHEFSPNGEWRTDTKDVQLNPPCSLDSGF